MTEHARFRGAEGIAALDICESLLLKLRHLDIICEKDARDLLTDVAAMCNEAAAAPHASPTHMEVVDIVRRMLGGGSCLQLPPRIS